MVHRNRIVALSIVMILLLPGCGLTGSQQEASARFARASADLGAFTAREFSGFRELTIEMNTRDIALDGEAKLTDLDEALDPEDLSARIGAATALSSYGRLLLALVEETQEAELKAASNNFVDSFKRVSGKKLDDSQYEALGTLVQEIGGMVVAHKKAKAVKRIVQAAEPDVDKICDLLIQDFSPTGLGVGQGVDVTYKRLKADADVALATPGRDYRNRLIATEAFQLADDAENRLTALAPQAVKTLMTLKKANAQLADAMKNNELSIDDIKALGKEIKQLADTARALSGK
jgi:hypothetical protein